MFFSCFILHSSDIIPPSRVSEIIFWIELEKFKIWIYFAAISILDTLSEEFNMANMWIYHPYTGELMNGPGPGNNSQNHRGENGQTHYPEHGTLNGYFLS